MDVDDANGDIYISFREFNGRVRGYERDASDGTYCATSTCYTQRNTFARYPSSIDVQDGYVYVNGYYWSSYYGGVKKFPTTGGVTDTMWSQFSEVGYKGSAAVTSAGDIYIASNYAFSYYNFQNWDDKIWVHDDTSGSASATLGPNPASLSYLSTPGYDTSAAIGMVMEFKISFQFYYLYEGAYMESSVDGGVSWDYIPDSEFTSGGYWGYMYANYNNPININLGGFWTYYNTNQLYTYNTHTAPWATQRVDLDAFTGFSDTRFRWVVGFNQYDNTYYYDSYFRLDDVSVIVKEAGVTYAEQTKTIASLGFKETGSVSFFDTPETAFRPSLEGLGVGDKLGILICI